MESQTISVVEGSTITLPCNVKRPFLNNYTVTWTANGESNTLASGQFNLQLNNISLSSDNRVYMCRVETSIDQPETGADATTTITLMVTPQHSKLLVPKQKVNKIVFSSNIPVSTTSELYKLLV